MSYSEREDTKKEILTKERMKQDVKENCIQYFKGSVGLFIFLIIFNIFVIFLISKMPSPIVVFSGINLHNLLTIIFVTFISLLSPFILYDAFKYLIKIKKNKFRITTDKLVGYKETDDVRLISSVPVSNSIYSDPYYLHFSSYGRFAIPRGKNYKWSEMYSMSDTGVYNYSNIGDEFYLLIIDDKIQAVYNTKLFELIE